MGEQLTVVIKPTRDCNLSCTYCSVGDPDKAYMTEEVVEQVVNKIVKREEKSYTKFIWHGGEPLLAGIDFYKNVVDLQTPLRREGYRVVNVVQTNGTLINDAWADFFKEQRFGVGLSIDGPKEVNNRTRIFKKEVGAFEAIQRGAGALERKGVDFGYLVVISKQNVGSIDKIIDFMKEQKRSYKLVAVAPIGRACRNQGDLMPEQNDFSESQLHLFNRWMNEGDPTQRAALWKYVVPVLTGVPIECIFQKDCQGSFIGVDSNGDAYPCGRFCGSNEYKYGNFNTNSFEEIWNNPLRVKISDRHKSLPQGCKSCDYVSICNGGCPLQALIAGGLEEKDYNCSQYKRIFQGIESRIVKESGLVDRL